MCYPRVHFGRYVNVMKTILDFVGCRIKVLTSGVSRELYLVSFYGLFVLEFLFKKIEPVKSVMGIKYSMADECRHVRQACLRCAIGYLALAH